jgi:hypothetical protein
MGSFKKIYDEVDGACWQQNSGAGKFRCSFELINGRAASVYELSTLARNERSDSLQCVIFAG